MLDLRSSLRSVAAAAAMTLVLACGDKNETAPTTPPATASLPAADSAKAVSTEDAATPAAPELVIELTPTGSGGVAMSLDGRVLSGDDELEREMRRALAASPGVAAVIKPTRATPHGEVIRVMDILKAAGIRRIAVRIAEAGSDDATPASGGR